MPNKIPFRKDIKEALDRVIAKHDKDGALMEIGAATNFVGVDDVHSLNTYFHAKGFIKLAEALVNGYEQQKEDITVTITPEQQEKIKTAILHSKSYQHLDGDDCYEHGIRAALNILNIKIEEG